MMSMYSDLLALSLIVADDQKDLDERYLLQEIAECRERLQVDQTLPVARKPDAPSQVATELEYDGALIKLCRLHAIPCDPARFTLPTGERRRLEDALESIGVDIRVP